MDHELQEIQERLRKLRAENVELCKENKRLKEHLAEAIAHLGAAMAAIVNSKAISEDRRKTGP
jgi:regulator of replication initiation timing